MFAKKSNGKDSSGILFDSRTKAVMTTLPHGNQESIKEKIAAVREVVPNRSNHEITLVLQYYENNVSEVIAAFMEDGAASALKSWNYTGSKPAKKKNKKKGNNKQAVGIPEGDQPAKEEATESCQDGEEPNDSDKDVATCENSDVPYESHQNGVMRETLISEVPDDKSDDASSVKTDSSEKMKPVHVNRVASTVKPNRYSSNQNSRQNSVSISDDPTSLKSSRGKKGLEKSIKELSRHTLSFQRSSNLLAEEIEKSQKRLQQSFRELHQTLEEREKQLAKELNVVKQQATDLLSTRQEQAAKIKVTIDRADGMTDAELNELRIDIKHFVSERKFDEDLWRTCRFVRDHDRLIREVREYGEVVPVKNQFTQRRQSVSSTTSSLTQSEPSCSVVASPTEKTPSVPLVANAEAPPDFAINLSSTSLNASELTELHQKLQESLRQQGLQTKAASRPGTASRHPASSSSRETDRSNARVSSSSDYVAQMNGDGSVDVRLPARDQRQVSDRSGRRPTKTDADSGEATTVHRGNYRRGNSRFPRSQNNRTYGGQPGNSVN